MKAGLSCDSWLLNDTKLYRFQANIFQERVPNGIVEIKKIEME